MYDNVISWTSIVLMDVFECFFFIIASGPLAWISYQGLLKSTLTWLLIYFSLSFFTFFFSDKEPPKIVYCPGPTIFVTAYNDPPYYVNYTDPVFSDNVGIDKVTTTYVKKKYDVPSSYNQYFRAYDRAGNSVECKFVVQIGGRHVFNRDLLFFYLLARKKTNQRDYFKINQTWSSRSVLHWSETHYTRGLPFDPRPPKPLQASGIHGSLLMMQVCHMKKGSKKEKRDPFSTWAGPSNVIKLF